MTPWAAGSSTCSIFTGCGDGAITPRSAGLSTAELTLAGSDQDKDAVVFLTTEMQSVEKMSSLAGSGQSPARRRFRDSADGSVGGR